MSAWNWGFVVGAGSVVLGALLYHVWSCWREDRFWRNGR